MKIKFNKFIIAGLLFILICGVGTSFASDNGNESTNLISDNVTLSSDNLSMDSILTDTYNETIKNNYSEDNSTISDDVVDELGNGSNLDNNSSSDNINSSIYSVNGSHISVYGDSFDNIQGAIDLVPENSTNFTIHLCNPIYYVNETQIIVNKTVTIDGGNATLDANYSSRIFCILADNVILKNLILMHGTKVQIATGLIFNYTDSYLINSIGGLEGSVIKWLGNNGVFSDSVLTDNEYYFRLGYKGAIISWDGLNGSIINSFVVNNTFYLVANNESDDFNGLIVDNSVHGKYFINLFKNSYLSQKGAYSNAYFSDVTVNVDPILDFNNGSSYYGKNSSIVFNLSGKNVPFTNETVQVNVFNDDYAQTFYLSTDDDGFITLDLGNKLPVGIYFIQAVFSDGVYNISSNGSLKINKAPVKYVLTNYTTSYNSGKLFNVKVLNSKNNVVVSSVKVALKVYTGKYYKTYYAKTNSKGIAKFNISKSSVGSHKVSISIINSTNFKSITKNTTIKISKAKTLVNISKLSFKYKKSDNLKIILTHKNNKKTLNTVSVKVKVYTGKNFKTYSLKTNNKGLISLNTKNLKKGSHKVIISSNNKNYLINKTVYVKIK